MKLMGIFEMAESNANIRAMVGILASQISVGWYYFVIAKFIREAYRNDRIQRAHTIFTYSYLVCWDAAILAVTLKITSAPSAGDGGGAHKL